jgi:hypothetical protein
MTAFTAGRLGAFLDFDLNVMANFSSFIQHQHKVLQIKLSKCHVILN